MQKISIGSIVLVSLGLLVAPVQANEPGSGFSWGSTLSNSALDSSRGGQGNITNEIDIDAEMSGNTVTLTNSSTGDNQISDQAFSNFYGVANVVQNSGSGVIVQNALIINFEMNSH